MWRLKIEDRVTKPISSQTLWASFQRGDLTLDTLVGHGDGVVFIPLCFILEELQRSLGVAFDPGSEMVSSAPMWEFEETHLAAFPSVPSQRPHKPESLDGAPHGAGVDAPDLEHTIEEHCSIPPLSPPPEEARHPSFLWAITHKKAFIGLGSLAAAMSIFFMQSYPKEDGSVEEGSHLAAKPLTNTWELEILEWPKIPCGPCLIRAQTAQGQQFDIVAKNSNEWSSFQSHNGPILVEGQLLSQSTIELKKFQPVPPKNP